MATRPRPDGLTIKKGQYKVKWWYTTNHITTHKAKGTHREPPYMLLLPSWIVIA